MRGRLNREPAELLALARKGEPDALGILLETYRNYLAVLTRVQIGRRFSGKADASDVIQETFLQAHRAFPQFRGATEAELVVWLRRILVSRLSKLVRRYTTKQRDLRLEQQLELELEKSSQCLDRSLEVRQSSPSQLAARREMAVLLADALEQLPEDYRDVMILHHLEGLSFPEVAIRVNRSIDSVKNVWARALARLRRSLPES